MTRAQEAEFWETHNATDYLEEMEPVKDCCVKQHQEG